ncbi:MAG: PorP/SprF family type IX secretion system membrane protein [Chitinophagaceae bacterium]|nr:PorP/SprF family type IX secretion system membrane protein [Chitinophagaceae bacterium]
MIRTIKIIGVLICCMTAFFVEAQDLHFSQFFNSPLLTNPANTGFIPDADYRIGASYRDQYSSLMAVPYKTMSIFGDAQVFRNRIENGWVGLGGVILHDVAGSGSLTSTKAYASVAYHQMLGLSSLVSAGFNIGWANKRIDQSKLKFPDQFDGKFFDNTLPTSVQLINNNISYFDVQAGLNYAYFPTQDIYINAGYSIHHVNRPKETFFDGTEDARIPVRHIGFVNAILKLNENVIINPNAYYTMQARASELVLGLNGAYNLTGAGEKQLIAGLYYRVGDAVIPMIGFELNHIKFTFSYDVTTSSLHNFNGYRGATEFNVIKNGFYNEYFGDKRQTLCPTF